MAKSIFQNSLMKKYAYTTIEDLFAHLGTSPKGLGLEQIEKMSKTYGENKIVGKKNDTLWYRFRRAFLNPFTMILFVLAMVSFITDFIMASNAHRTVTTSLIILTMILVSGFIRLMQELRAKNASDRLNLLVYGKVTLRRDGILLQVSAENIVVGDVVLLMAGDRIPADLRLIRTTDLFVSQAAITGESAILEKSNTTYHYADETPFMELGNLAFMGTTVISGKGEGVVSAVGKETLYGNFVKMDMESSTSFEKGANSIAWVMIRFMAVLVPIVFIVSGITKGEWIHSFVFSLSVAVGLTPEMLPMVIIACLAKGSLSMSKKQTIIKNINAMQGFGSMDVLCMDKTGTLTNETVLLEYYMDILGNESSEVLDLAYLNSFFHSGIRNPIDNAILACKTMPKREQYFFSLVDKYDKIDELPFDYDRKCVSAFVQDAQGNRNLIMKGSLRQVIRRCSTVDYQGERLPMNQNDTASVCAIVDEMIEDGMKVIAIAKKNLRDQDILSSTDENDMTLMGYLAFFDAPKATAKHSIMALKKLHVSPKILTGDLAQIAFSVCRRVGMETSHILTGEEINDFSDAELRIQVELVDVFAELNPRQKVRILSALQENGHTVGFLGDGMNDIPALSAADVGISVDTGVDAAKSIADVVLLQKDLGVLEEGVLEGRRTFANMLKYIKITASSNFGNIFSIVCAGAFLPFLPMTAVQLLLLNLLYDVLCIVLPWDTVDDEDVATPRGWSGKTLSRFMLSFGPISSIFDILTFVFLYFVLCPSLCGGMLFTELADPSMKLQYIAIFQTGWFLESMWTQILILHMLRTKKNPFVQSCASPPVLLITLTGIVTYTILTFLPSTTLFGLATLPVWYFIFLFIIVTLYMLLITIAKKSFVKRYEELI